jgi:predicted Zn-dependent protease
MADFFITLQRQPGSGGAKAERLPEFFSTHPNPVNREATVRALAVQWQSKTPGQLFRVNREQFLNHIDGLVYGDDPRLGFREGDWYYLPHYKVKIPVPKGWRLEREGNNLQLSHPQNKAAAIVNIRTSNNMDQVISGFLQSTGARVQQQRVLTSGPMPGRQILSVISSGRQYAVIASYFYQNGPDVFALHGITGGDDYSTMGDVMQQPGSGFAVMTDPAKLNRQPRRIALTTLEKSTSMQQTLQAMKIQRDLWEEIAWLNGRQLTDMVSAGTRLKLVR